MLDLLIAILIALGCNVSSDATADQIRTQNPDAYARAEQIAESGTYKTVDGGVVVVEIGGD